MSDKSTSEIDFDRIVELISKFDLINKSGEIKSYNEELTKKDFILPLFEALGWNVYNRAKRNDSISAEETISKKRVDYGFRINGIPKFFLEAKSLKDENIQTNSKYITQAIDYSWMKSCSWAILCNFETIAVYNADWKGSNFGNNLLFILHPNDFLTNKRFNHLSKSAFMNNELNEIASEYGKKQSKNPINKQLLQDMIHFREILSKDIIRNNQEKHLSQDELDESVQRILDRLIFIRNAEDREIEENRLQSNLRQWTSRGKGQLIKEISKIYDYFDGQYNSKLFAKHLCDGLYLDNEVLLEVIEGLNHSIDNSYRYDFSVIESDVLGNIYEQYLGNILKTTTKRAKLSESKTHRKEQGIYYTPSNIVDYIVKSTVGEYIEMHTSEEIRNVKILDPSCGSGSFLIKAYQELEKYWKNKYGDQETLKYDEDGGFYSTKVEILKNNIFGVDLDPKAVEIAQLNLLLQISERKQKLPVIQNNIKIGNSLIDDLNSSERAFNWEEQFPEIVKNGGFDIIIGNPPYVRIQYLDKKESIFFNNNFESATKNYDIYVLFVEKSLKFLSKNGVLGFILPSKFVNADYGIGLRNIISKSKSLYRILDFKDIQVFESATNYTCLLFLKNTENEEFIYQYPRDKNSFSLSQLSNKDTLETIRMELPSQNSTWVISDKNSISLMKKIESKGPHLGTICKYIFQGLTTSADSIYFVKIVRDTGKSAEIKNIKDGREFEIEKGILRPLLKGKDVRKWVPFWDDYFVIYPYKVIDNKAHLIHIDEIESEYPLAFKYLKNYENELKLRENNEYKDEIDWHQYIYRKNLEKFEQRKLLTQVLSSRNTFAIDETSEFYFVGGGNAGVYGVVLKDDYKDLYYYALALLNSKILEFYLKNISTPFRGGYFSYGKRFIEQLPLSLSSDAKNGEINRLSRRIVEMRKKIEMNSNKKTNEINRIIDEIEAETIKLDKEIYALYGLTSKEIHNIESFLDGN